MPNVRPTSKWTRWQISKYAFRTAYNYALQYGEWLDEYRTALYNLQSPQLNGMPHSGTVSNPTEMLGIRANELKAKTDLIEETVKETDPALFPWLLKAVTNEGVTYNYLRTVMQIPCGKNIYYEARRKFYYLLAKKINA